MVLQMHLHIHSSDLDAALMILLSSLMISSKIVSHTDFLQKAFTLSVWRLSVRYLMLLITFYQEEVELYHGDLAIVT